MKGKATDYHMLVRMIREIKVPRDRFRCVLVVFLYVTKMFSELVAKSSPCFAEMTFAKVQVKCSVIFIDRLGPDIFSTLRMKGHVLHRARAHLKVPG